MTTETKTTETATQGQPAANTSAIADAAAATGSVFDDGKAAAIAKIEAMRAEKAKAAEPAQQQAPAQEQAAAELAAETPAEGQDGEKKEEGQEAATAENTAPDEEAKAAKALLAAARENRALIEERKRLAARDRALAEKEKQLQTTTSAEREAMARLQKAVQGGDPIEILRAAGLKDDSLSQFALNMIERLPTIDGDDEQKKAQAARPPTAEEVAALVLKQQQEAEKTAKEKAEADSQARMSQQRDEYFSALGSEFKTNAKAYPLVAAVAPTLGELEARFVQHYQRTGERLTPSGLLATLEKEYAGRGIVLAPKKPAQQKTETATSKTIGAKATSDGGAVAVQEERDPRKVRDVHDVYEEGKAKVLKAIADKRAARAAK